MVVRVACQVAIVRCETSDRQPYNDCFKANYTLAWWCDGPGSVRLRNDAWHHSLHTVMLNAIHKCNQEVAKSSQYRVLPLDLPRPVNIVYQTCPLFMCTVTLPPRHFSLCSALVSCMLIYHGSLAFPNLVTQRSTLHDVCCHVCV